MACARSDQQDRTAARYGFQPLASGLLFEAWASDSLVWMARCHTFELLEATSIRCRDALDVLIGRRASHDKLSET